MLKGKVVRSNRTLKKKDVKELTEDAFESISPEKWASCCRHVKAVEKRFYATDIAVDDQVVVVVVVLGFYVPPTAKVIRRRDLGLESHPKASDWRSSGSNSRPLVYKASSLTATPRRLLDDQVDRLVMTVTSSDCQ